MLFGISFCKGYKVVDIRSDGFYPTLHGWNGIALPLQTNTFAQFCAKTQMSYTSSTTSVHTSKIATKNKYFIILKSVYPLWGDSSLFHIIHIIIL